MRALKAIVILLGILLVVGTGVLIWGVARQIDKLGRGDQAETPVPSIDTTPAVVATDVAPWGRLDLKQPAGTRIQAVTNSGDYIVLHLYTHTPGTDERVVVIEPGTGTLMGTINLQ